MGVAKCGSDLFGYRTEVRDEHIRDRPSLIYDTFLQRTEVAIRANRCLNMKEWDNIISDVSMKSLYEAVSVTLGHRKLCVCWIPKMLTEEIQMKRVDFAFGFFTLYRRCRL
ncbi:hypothetical protein AVEN_121523-1 [Araneus ventricosus]|uniref:Uncharacterized protein n=1 Tax=Araneus ventricosus TaxID=182803 RepID=A0A4Y2N4Z7_ARAVE|nr:hypothetical protein AVEN_121523-1 [Araneus ventricosus]